MRQNAATRKVQQSGDHWKALNKHFPATVLNGHRRIGVQQKRGPNRKGWTRSYVEVLINLDFLIVIPYSAYAPVVLMPRRKQLSGTCLWGIRFSYQGFTNGYYRPDNNRNGPVFKG